MRFRITLAFDCVIGNANGGAVVTMDGCGGLWMAHFLKGYPQYFSVLGIEEECTKFRLSGRSCNKFEYGAYSVYGPIEFDGLGIFREVAKEVMASGSGETIRFIHV